MKSNSKYSFNRFLFFALFAFAVTTSQAQAIDSLKSILKRAPEDTQKVNTFLNLAVELHKANKYEESFLCINEGIALAEKLNYSSGQGELHRIKGDYFKIKASYSKSLQEYTKALAVESQDARKSKIALTHDKLAKLYADMGEFSKAVTSLEKELKWYKEIHDTLRISKVLLDLWEVQYKNLKDLPKAAACLEEVREIVNTTSSDTTLSNLYNELGTFFSAERDYEKAAEYLNKSLVLHEKKNDLKKMAVDYYDMGGLYEKVGNYRKALECYQEILKIRLTLGDKSDLGIAYNNVGWGYQLAGDYEKALDYQLNSYKYYLEAGNYDGTKFPIGNLGVIYNKLGDYRKAIEYSLRSMDLFEKSKNFNGVAEANNNIGMAYANSGEYNKAIDYLNKGLALALQGNASYEVQNAYSGLALCYENLKEYKQAFQYYKLFSQLRDTIVSQENSDRVNGMSFNMENEKNQKAIELLSKDVLLNEINLKRQRTLTYSAIAGVLLTFFLMFFVIREYRQKKQSNVLLEQSNKELEKSYHNTKLLSEMGREITASLSIEDIIQNVYKNMNSLMDATSFWIGIYNEADQSIDFPMGIEKGKTAAFVSFKLSQNDLLPVWAFKNQKEVFVNDYLNEYHNYIPNIVVPGTLAGGRRPESFIGYPLISKDGKTIGILSVQSFQKNAYTEYHFSIVRSLAVFASIALENALLYNEVEQKVIERTVEVIKQKEEIEQSYSSIKLLSDIGREITASLLVEDIIEKVYERINTLMDAPIFLIGIFDAKKNRLTVPGTIEKGVRQPLFYYNLEDKSRPAVWCFEHQRELVMNDTAKDFNTYFPGIPPPAPLAGENPESLIYFPLTTATKKIGVISFQSFRKNSYKEYQLDIVRTLAIYVSTALENARLYGNMEAEVKERTAEIEKQKDELAKLSIVASETDSAIIIADAQGNIEWVNASFTRLTGYSLEDLKAESKTSIIAISGNPKIKEILNDCVELSKSAVYVVKNKTKDGREIWLQTTLTPISGQDGKIKNLVAIDSDITELKSVETELKQQHAIISEKNKHITDSINYAKRIQDAILPPGEVVRDLFQDAFVLYRPKDIVSGDFYWMIEKADKLFFAVVDCTGHGVPGAFVSIIGYNGLNRAVNEFGLTRPSEILDKLTKLVEEIFGQSHQTQIQDGMDIALCSYDRKTRELEFSGANNPLYVISGGILAEIKGDKQPIGAFDHRKKFTNNSLTLKKDDSIYIFSDGYADQFGGPSKKKFKYNKFKSLLVSLSRTPMQEQKEALNHTITNWMGNLEQVDDICVIGMKV